MTDILEISERTATLKHMQSITPKEKIAEAKKMARSKKKQKDFSSIFSNTSIGVYTLAGPKGK